MFLRKAIQATIIKTPLSDNIKEEIIVVYVGVFKYIVTDMAMLLVQVFNI